MSRRFWAAVGVLGEILITLGIVVLLFLAYQLWWTNVLADANANQQVDSLQDDWASPKPTASDQPAKPRPPIPDKAFALMYIPRLTDDVWGEPVVEGISESALASGLGHYPETALPGEIGNFAVAGHRATNGEPLRNIDQLRAGDEVIVETEHEFLTYVLETDKIVNPDATWVIDPVPGQPGATPTEELITLTTCNPRWASYTRWIWWGRLTGRIDKVSGELPPALEKN